MEDKSQDGGYPTDIFDNLVFRFEEPNGMTRWDSPLFTVPFDDATPPCDEIWNALVGMGGEIKKVKPNQATIMVGYWTWKKRFVIVDRIFRNLPLKLITYTNLTELRKRSSTKLLDGRQSVSENLVAPSPSETKQ